MRYEVCGREACTSGPISNTADAARVEAERWVPLKLGDWLALGEVARAATGGCVGGPVPPRS